MSLCTNNSIIKTTITLEDTVAIGISKVSGPATPHPRAPRTISHGHTVKQTQDQKLGEFEEDKRYTCIHVLNIESDGGHVSIESFVKSTLTSS